MGSADARSPALHPQGGCGVAGDQPPVCRDKGAPDSRAGAQEAQEEVWLLERTDVLLLTTLPLWSCSPPAHLEQRHSPPIPKCPVQGPRVVVETTH